MKTQFCLRASWIRGLLGGLLAIAGLTCSGQTAMQIKQAGDWPPYPKDGGEAFAVVVRNDLAYVGNRAGLTIFDVTDPTNFVYVGCYRASGGVSWDVALSGNYAYLACDTGGIQVVDVSDPSHPFRVGTYVNDESICCNGAAMGVAVSGNRAYVAYFEEGLCVLDITDPTNPRLLGRRPTTGTAQFNKVAVSGRYAYVAAENAGLEVIDVANPVNPVRVGGYGTQNERLGYVAVSGSYVYLHTSDALHVINVGNPANPVRVGGYQHGGEFQGGVAVVGDRAYLAWYGVSVLDVSDPVSPVWLGSAGVGGGVSGVAVAGNFVFFAGSAGLEVIEVSDPRNPVLVARDHTPYRAQGVATAGNYAYVTGGGSMYVFDLAGPANTVPVGTCRIYEHGPIGYEVGSGAGLVAVGGNFAYVVGYRNLGVVHVVDVSNPTNCVWMGTCTNGWSEWPWGIAAAGQHVCVADGGNGLHVIDASNPASPFRAGGYNTSGSARGVATSGKYAYVADDNAGLQVIDVSDAAHPVRVGGCPTRGPANGVAVTGGYALVTEGWIGGLEVIDVSQPANCRHVTNYYTWDAMGVTVSGPYAYVVDNGLLIFDVSNPARPVLLASYQPAGGAEPAMAVSGNYVLVVPYYVGKLQLLETDACPRLPADSLTRRGDGRWQFRVSGALGQVLEIQSTTDWHGWSPIGWMTNTSGNGLFTDPGVGPDHRFYRARVIR